MPCWSRLLTNVGTCVAGVDLVSGKPTTNPGNVLTEPTQLIRPAEYREAVRGATRALQADGRRTAKLRCAPPYAAILMNVTATTSGLAVGLVGSGL